MKLNFAAAAAAILLPIKAIAAPIEAYGNLPAVRSVAISPNGEYVASIVSKDADEALTVYKLGKGVVGGVRIDKIKADEVEFAGSKHVILHAAETQTIRGFLGRIDYSAAFSYSIASKNVVQLLLRARNLYRGQSGLGSIISLYHGDKEVLMPAYMTSNQRDSFVDVNKENPTFDLLHVDLDTGNASTLVPGQTDTKDWIARQDGEVLAREDYDNATNRYRILAKDKNHWKPLIDLNAPQPPISLVGVLADYSALVIMDAREDSKHPVIRQLFFDGKLSGPMFERPDSDIEGVMRDINRVVYGVQYSGFYPTYKFFDEKLTDAIGAVQSHFANASVTLESWTDDFQNLVFLVEGSGEPGGYYLFNRKTKQVKKLASERPNIPDSDVAEILTIQYKARDGLTIPALLTMPTTGKMENLPLIVMPHGGPASHDEAGFDWMAQFFASRGYLIFQPEFRGSDGFGAAFQDAGRGEWGGKMQDDITDGVKALINAGRANASRICIVGGSYGGYAALAGGAFTPDLYKCVAAIAPVSDLPDMIGWEKYEHGPASWVVDYWKEVMGDPSKERDKLEAISPAYHADAFTAPVLLIHGKDDTTVPISQSTRMESQLKKAGKEVTLIKLAGEDHYLSKGETRLETLKALNDFVTKEIGGG